MSLWYRFLVRILGEEICENCGSNNILQQGYEDMNHRHFCRYCGHITEVHLV